MSQSVPFFLQGLSSRARGLSRLWLGLAAGEAPRGKYGRTCPFLTAKGKKKKKKHTKSRPTAAGAKISQMDGRAIKKRAQLVATMHELGGVTSQMLISIGIRTQGHNRQTGHVSTNLSTGKVKRKRDRETCLTYFYGNSLVCLLKKHASISTSVQACERPRTT